MTALGWTAGIGVEYTFWAPLSVKVEYLHADFGRQFFPNTPNAAPHDVTLTDDLFRIGVNYNFIAR